MIFNSCGYECLLVIYCLAMIAIQWAGKHIGQLFRYSYIKERSHNA